MKKLFSLLMLLFVFSCSVEDGNMLNDISSKPVENSKGNSIQFREIDASCTPEYVDLIKRYLRDYNGNSPEVLFSEKLLNIINVQLTLEKSKLESQGFDTYVNNLKNANTISLESMNLLINISDYVESKTEIELQNINLVEYFKGVYNDENIKSNDPYYCFLYDVILEVFTVYEEGEIEFRGDKCNEFKEFFLDFIDGTTAGVNIGGSFVNGDGQFIVELLDLTFSVAGGFIGATVGIINGIFTWGKNCDCGPVTSLTIQSDDNCGLTRTIIAGGAGPDVAGFIWTITQNGISTSITTTSQYLSITQTNQNNPIHVSVIAICPRGEQEPIGKSFNLNVVDINNPLGQVGELSLQYVCAVEENAGNGNPYSCFMTNEINSFYWVSSNQGSGNISYSYSITPNDIAYIVDENDQDIDVSWIYPGNAILQVTAINNCTGEETSKSMNIYIPF